MELEECNKTYHCLYINESVDNSDPQIQLILTNYLSESLNGLFIKKIDLFLIVFKITHLDVDCSKISISIVIELIQQLFYLKFLRMSHLPPPETEDWVKENRRTIRLSQKNHNITKVNLDSISQVEQAQFAHYLCPFVQYLIISCTNDIDPVLLIQFIFRTNAKFIKYLNLLCLSIPSIRDETIEKLCQMINSGQHRYTIKHTDKIIYFQRKS